MLLAEFHQAVIAFDKIGGNDFPVIIAINIHNSENRVSLMLRKDRHYAAVSAK